MPDHDKYQNQLASQKFSAHDLRVINTKEQGTVLQLADGTIQGCNPAAEEILGLTAEQLIGRTCLDPPWQAIHEDGSP